jgi:hypothetical protein
MTACRHRSHGRARRGQIVARRYAGVGKPQLASHKLSSDEPPPIRTLQLAAPLRRPHPALRENAPELRRAVSKLAADRRPALSRNRHTPALVRWRLHDEAGEAAAVAPKARKRARQSPPIMAKTDCAQGLSRLLPRRALEYANKSASAFGVVVREMVLKYPGCHRAAS